MRWSSFTLGAALALAGTAYGSYESDMMVGGAVGGMFQRRTQDQNDTAGAILEARQAGAGRCGSDGGGAKCPASQCCSQWGYCGVGNEFCNPIALCQSEFGSCLGASQPATPAPVPSSTPARPPPVTTTTPPVVAPPPPPPPPPPPVTTTSTPRPPPPPPPTTTTPPRPPPSSTPVVVAPPPASPSPVSPAPGGALIPSTNGMCGNTTTCAGSGKGSCCSEYFYCGDGIEFCGNGCQPRFGLCFGGLAGGGGAAPAPPPSSSRAPSSTAVPVPVSSPARSSTTAAAAPTPIASPVTTPPRPSSTSAAAPAPSAAPPAALPPGVSVTTDGSCGGGKTCLGSTFGQCCSQFGFCGNGDQFCPFIVACQPEWGHCDPATN